MLIFFAGYWTAIVRNLFNFVSYITVHGCCWEWQSPSSPGS